MPTLKRHRIRNTAILLGAAVLPAWLIAQNAEPIQPNAGPTNQPAAPAPVVNKTLHLASNLGSFKMLPKTELASGRVEITFTGTLLLSNFKGKATLSPGLNKEYDGNNRTVYFGSGTAVIDGSFRGIQWFGTNMTASWTGDGVIRLYGEFDQDLNTGSYWYDDRTQATDWGTYGLTAEVPKRPTPGDVNVVPRRRPPGAPE